MSRTSGRSLRGLLEEVPVGWVRGALDWSNLARGWVEMVVSSSKARESELSEELEVLRRFWWVCFFAAEGFAHSGTGYKLSN